MESVNLKTQSLDWGTEGVPADIARRVILNNKITLWWVLLSLCLIPVTGFVAGFIPALVFVATSVLGLIGLMLSFLGHITWARVSLVLSFLAMGWVFSGALGAASGVQLWYLVSLVAAFALFHRNEKQILASMLLLAIVVLFFDYFLGHDWHVRLLVPPGAIGIISTLLLVAAVFFVLLLVWSIVTLDAQAFAQARAEKHKLQAVVTTLNDVIFEIDETHKVLNVWAANDENLPVSRETYEATPPEKLLPPNIYRKFAEHVQRVLDTGTGERFEYQSPNNHRWYEASIELIHPEPGDTLKKVSMALHDITRERETRQRIYVQNQIVNHHLNGIIYTDLAGKILFVNDAACRVYVASEVSLVGSTLEFADLPEHLGVATITSYLQHQQSWRGDVIQRRMNGQKFNARLMVFRVMDENGRVQGLAWNIKDVTDLREAEDRLKMSEKRFRSMAENAPGVVVEFHTDRAGREWGFNYVSPKLREIFKTRQESLLVDNQAILRMIVPEDQKLFLESLRQAIVTGNRWEFKVRLSLNEPGQMWMRGILTPIDTQSDRLIFHGLLMDVTQEQSYKEVLLAAKDAAVSATQAKSDFLAIMSHEIRTPLNALIGLSHLLLLENPRDDQIENLRTLKFSAESLLALINDILDFGKIEAGKVQLEEIPFSVRELAEGIVSSMSYQAEDKGIRLRCKIDAAIPETLIGDPTRLAQILNNLISNAIKFTLKGSVDIKVFWRGTEQNRTKLEFRITDTGIGIAPDKQKLIFRFFSQADTSVTRQFGGTGLGLAITRSLLRLFGSEIYLRSKPGEGSTFYFELLMGVADTRTSTPASLSLSGEDPDLSGYRILLVDDNRVNVLVAMKLLTKWGAQVDSAESGEMAYEMAQNNAYHLVLMDIQMPGMDGYEATRAIRNLDSHHNKTIPILALTATVIDEVIAKADEVGLNGVLSKPIRPVELKRSLLRYLVPETEIT